MSIPHNKSTPVNTRFRPCFKSRGRRRFTVPVLFWVLTVFTIPPARAALTTSIPQIGPHYPLFRFEKNENPQNILIVYTRLTSDCQPVVAAGGKQKPVLDFYWLMNGNRYKPVHPLIKGGIAARLTVEPISSVKNPPIGPRRVKSSVNMGTEPEKIAEFSIKLSDLKELKQDLPEPGIRIEVFKQGQFCEIRTLVHLGPSGGSKTLQLAKIISQSEKTLLPPFRKVKQITLSGSDSTNGEILEQSFKAPP